MSIGYPAGGFVSRAFTSRHRTKTAYRRAVKSTDDRLPVTALISISVSELNSFAFAPSLSARALPLVSSCAAWARLGTLQGQAVAVSDIGTTSTAPTPPDPLEVPLFRATTPTPSST